MATQAGINVEHLVFFPGEKIVRRLDEFPELAPAGSVPCELICEEFFVRKQARLASNMPKSPVGGDRLLSRAVPRASTTSP